MPYSKLFYCKNSWRYGEKKTWSQKWLLSFSSFFRFIQTYFAISWTVGVDFNFIRFVFSLAFQRYILNCFTAKTYKDIAKWKRKVENNGKGDDSLMLRKIYAAFKLSAQALYCTTWPTFSAPFDILYITFAEGFYIDLIRVNTDLKNLTNLSHFPMSVKET